MEARTAPARPLSRRSPSLSGAGLAGRRGLKQDLPQLCKNKVVREAVLASMLKEGQAAKLRSFEQVLLFPAL